MMWNLTRTASPAVRFGGLRNSPKDQRTRCRQRVLKVARAGIEPATFRFSGGRSYQLSYLAGRLSAFYDRESSPNWRP